MSPSVPPPSGYSLRAAHDDDAETVRELVFAALREHGLEPSPHETDADLNELTRHYHASGGRFDLLIENQGHQIVGTVGLHPDEPGTVELRKMYLRPGHRGRGCGRFLLDHAVAEARRSGFRRIILETTSRLPRAVDLYRRYGFRPCAARPCASRCDQTMELLLDPT